MNYFSPLIYQKIGLISLLLLQTFFSSSANCFDKFSIDINQIQSNNWQINNASLSLQDINSPTQQLVLSIKQLALPEPFSQLTLLDVQCSIFSWQEKKVSCSQGQAKLKENMLDSSTFDFMFEMTDKKNSFSLSNIKIAKGSVSIEASLVNSAWQLNIHSNNLQLQQIQSLLFRFKLPIENITSGQVNADFNAVGNDDELQQLNIKLNVEKLSLEANQGALLTDSLGFDINLNASLQNGNWLWQTKGAVKQGEIYSEPVFLSVEQNPFQFNAKGSFQPQANISIQQANLAHQGIYDLNFSGILNLESAALINQAYITVDIRQLELFSQHYLAAFFEQTAMEGLSFSGQLFSELEIEQSKLIKASSLFKDLNVFDDKQRIAVEKANAEIYWTIDSEHHKPSLISWHQIKAGAIPIGSGKLKFLAKNQTIALLEKSAIPLLGGFLTIEQFNWLKETNKEPKISFMGDVSDLSLDQLTQALDVMPLSGQISGRIPAVDYKDNILSTNGELSIKVFDGEIRIKHLATSGIFTDFSKFYMDMAIENIDLYALTQKVQMGAIEGRVSGNVNNLYLENWHPITFYAWLGTPENDQSTHRISQKAVENIASIGGGGAADVISKGFLRFFDTFGYDKLGMGCYLNEGVCQLMGVEAAEQGYYLIKGGGIPRIDIIGYNPRVDWDVLLRRLARVVATDQVVIE